MLHKLDQYFDLTSGQRQDLTERINSILARHRQEALPEYEAFLVQIRHRVERGITPEDVDWFYAGFDRLRNDLFERLIVDGGVFLASVDQNQTKNLEAALRKENEKAAAVARITPTERIKKRVDSTLEVVADWTGSVSREQRVQVSEWSKALPDTQPLFFRYREQRQHELLTLLRQPRTSEGATRELRAALVHQDQTAPAWYLQALEEWRNGIKQLVTRIDRTMTSAQRRYALDKLQRLINQVHDLRNG